MTEKPPASKSRPRQSTSQTLTDNGRGASEPTPAAPRLEQVLRVHAPVLLRSAAALELAAEQLRDTARAPASLRSVGDLRSGCLTALHAALSAYELLGRFELAAELETAGRYQGGRGGAVP